MIVDYLVFDMWKGNNGRRRTDIKLILQILKGASK